MNNQQPLENRSKHVSREAPVLDPRLVKIRPDGRGRLQITLPDGSVHTGGRLYPAFPISRRHRFIYLFSEDDTELGLIQDPRQLDNDSRDLVLTECDQVYFMPRISHIYRVYERNGIAYWNVETDRGPCSFQVISRSESVFYVGRNRLLIRDVDGNRYTISDLVRLDKRSRLIAELNI